MKKFIALLIMLFAVSGCSPAEKTQNYKTPEIPQIKDGIYYSDSDDSYLVLSDGYIELKNYDIGAVLQKKYEEGIKLGFIDPEKDNYDDFYKNSVEEFNALSGKKKFSIKAMPDMSILLVTEENETGNGGGSYEGYTVVNENTMNGNGNSYIYSEQK